MPRAFYLVKEVWLGLLVYARAYTKSSINSSKFYLTEWLLHNVLDEGAQQGSFTQPPSPPPPPPSVSPTQSLVNWFNLVSHLSRKININPLIIVTWHWIVWNFHFVNAQNNMKNVKRQIAFLKFSRIWSDFGNPITQPYLAAHSCIAQKYGGTIPPNPQGVAIN